MITSRPFRYDLDLVFRRSIRKSRRRLLVVGIVAEIAMMVFAALALTRRGSVGVAIGTILFAPLYVGFIYAVVVRRLKKALHDPKNRFGTERTISFDEETLAWTFVEGGRSEMPWREAQGQERFETTSIVWISGQQALFIPDAAWSGEDLPIWRARVERLRPFAP